MAPPHGAEMSSRGLQTEAWATLLSPTMPLEPGLVTSLASPPPLPSLPRPQAPVPRLPRSLPSGPLAPAVLPANPLSTERVHTGQFVFPCNENALHVNPEVLVPQPTCLLPTLTPAPGSPGTGPLHSPPLLGLLPWWSQGWLWSLRPLARGGLPWLPALTLSIAQLFLLFAWRCVSPGAWTVPGSVHAQHRFLACTNEYAFWLCVFTYKVEMMVPGLLQGAVTLRGGVPWPGLENAPGKCLGRW